VIFDTIEVRIELEAAAFAKDSDAKPLNQHRGKTTWAHLTHHAGNITKEKRATVKTVDLARN
jgi:hypothetical protein